MTAGGHCAARDVVTECAHPYARAVVVAIARIEVFITFRIGFSNLSPTRTTLALYLLM
jgi:hypothetical protein